MSRTQRILILIAAIYFTIAFIGKAKAQTNPLHARYGGNFKGQTTWVTYTETVKVSLFGQVVAISDTVKHKDCVRKIGELKPGLRAIRLSNVRPVEDILKLDICGISEHFDMFEQELDRAQTEFATCLGRLTLRQKQKRFRCIATDLKCSPIAQTMYNVRDYWIHWQAVAYPFSHLPARIEDWQEHLILGIYGTGGLDLYIAHRDWCEKELKKIGG